jgi:hypothetical protein
MTRVRARTFAGAKLGTANPPQPELKPRLCCYLPVLTFVGRFQSFKSRRPSGIELTERKYCTPVPSRFAREEVILMPKTGRGPYLGREPRRVTTITRKSDGGVQDGSPLFRVWSVGSLAGCLWRAESRPTEQGRALTGRTKFGPTALSMIQARVAATKRAPGLNAPLQIQHLRHGDPRLKPWAASPFKNSNPCQRSPVFEIRPG